MTVRGIGNVASSARPEKTKRPEISQAQLVMLLWEGLEVLQWFLIFFPLTTVSWKELGLVAYKAMDGIQKKELNLLDLSVRSRLNKKYKGCSLQQKLREKRKPLGLKNKREVPFL